jgi:hypothetical protein
MNAKVQTHTARRPLRLVVVAGGIGTSIFFIVAGLWSGLQMFGDGSIFSYAIAAQDAWAFHWHNISGRLFTYVFADLPSEAIVALTGSAKTGIAVYGLLFFSAPLLGLLATLAADRTAGRVILRYACLSTLCLCPLVFGAPTEMWMAHAIFWPALAVCLCAPTTWRGAAAVFAALLALIFSHGGAVIFAAVIVFATFLRGGRDAIFMRALTAFAATLAGRTIVKLALPPDDYIASVLMAAAYRFIDLRNLVQPVVMLLLAAMATYATTYALLQRLSVQRAHVYAASACAVGLAIYWVWFDESLLAEARYNLRTALLIVVPVLGIMAALQAIPEGMQRRSPLPMLRQLALAVEKRVDLYVIIGALLLTMLVHVVETSKFVSAWTSYKAAIRLLAMSGESDPNLGNPLFVSARRIDAKLNRLAWKSTTPYLSVLLAPDLKPARLVVDPGAAYFWLPCDTAQRSERTGAPISENGRRLIRLYSCLHR